MNAVIFPIYFHRLASRAIRPASQGALAEAVVPTTGTARSAVDDVNAATSCCPAAMDTSGMQPRITATGDLLSAGSTASRPGPSVVSLRSRRRAGSGFIKEPSAYRVDADTQTGGRIAGTDWINTGRSMRDTCRPFPTLRPVEPLAINHSASSPRARTTPMAQRDSLPVQFAERVYTIKRRRISGAQSPDSPGGVHVTADEHAEIADISDFEREYNRWLAFKVWLDRAERLGLDAPTVQRGLRELMRDFATPVPDHDLEGMRS